MRSSQTNASPRRGVLLLEACVSLMLVGLVLAMVSLLLTRYARSTDYYLNYRRAQLAAESCVERMRAGVLDVTEATFTDETGVTFEIRVKDADVAWQPLKRFSVTATVIGKYHRSARYQLRGYVEPGQTSQGGGQ